MVSDETIIGRLCITWYVRSFPLHPSLRLNDFFVCYAKRGYFNGIFYSKLPIGLLKNLEIFWLTLLSPVPLAEYELYLWIEGCGHQSYYILNLVNTGWKSLWWAEITTIPLLLPLLPQILHSTTTAATIQVLVYLNLKLA